jgi:hypothetical protein
MSLSDLENDFLNPYDLCNRLNRYVVRARARHRGPRHHGGGAAPGATRRQGTPLAAALRCVQARQGPGCGCARAPGTLASGGTRPPARLPARPPARQPPRQPPPPPRPLNSTLPPPPPRPQALEYGVQAGLALLLILSGNWLTGACHLALLGYMVHLWAGNKVFVDVTDVFRQLPDQKQQRLVQLGAHTALFMFVVYRCVAAAVAAARGTPVDGPGCCAAPGAARGRRGALRCRGSGGPAQTGRAWHAAGTALRSPGAAAWIGLQQEARAAGHGRAATSRWHAPPQPLPLGPPPPPPPPPPPQAHRDDDPHTADTRRAGHDAGGLAPMGAHVEASRRSRGGLGSAP